MVANRNCIIITSLLLIVSCNTNELCEGFDIKRIPYTKKYYLQNLNYTNGKDTVTIFPEVKDFSKESFINPVSHPDCLTIFSIYYDTKVGNKIDILYSFNYYPQDNFTNLNLSINSSRFEIDVYPTSKDSVYFIDDFEHLNESDSNFLIKNVLIQKMKIIEFETLLGEKWSLLR